MMKRSLAKSGSTVTSSTSNLMPSYQPLSPMTTNKQSSSEAVGIYNILQESKRNKSTRIQSGSSTSNQSSLSSALVQNKNGMSMQTGSAITPIGLPQSYSSNNTVSSANSIKVNEQISLLQLNQRLLLSAQKASSLHSATTLANGSALLNCTNPINNNNNTSKSPLNCGYRSQTQLTPTSQKNGSSVPLSQNGCVSPKTLLTSGNKNAQMFHSHRPSLVNSSATQNENLNQNRRHESKPELQQKKAYYSSTESSSHQNPVIHHSVQAILNTNPLSILRENNSIKNFYGSISNSLLNHQQQHKQQSKDLPGSISDSNGAKGVRNNSNSAADSAHNINSSKSNSVLNNINNLYPQNTYTTNLNVSNTANTTDTITNSSSLAGNPLKDSTIGGGVQGSSANQFYQNHQQQQLSSERNYMSGIRTPKSPKTLSNPNLSSSKSNTHFIFNTTNPTQNTEIDIQHLTSTDQHSNNIMNISSISGINVSQNNLTERSTHPDQFKLSEATDHDNSQQDLFAQKCSNHPYKKAKYIIYNSQSSNNLYCSKCAVELSKFGFQTIHVHDFASQQQQKQQEVQRTHLPQPFNTQQGNQEPPSQEKSITSTTHETETTAKLNEIELFLQSINAQGGKWQELNHALIIKKKDVSNFFERQQSRIEAQYGGYIELINSIKDQTMKKLNANREKSIQIYQNWEKETKESLTDFINIKADIEMNTDKIVNLIQMDDFSRIMNSYKEKLGKMTSFFHIMGNECLDLVKFDSSAPNFYSMSGQIEHSFNIVNFSTTLVKKRVSEFMSTKNGQVHQQVQHSDQLPSSSQYLYGSNSSNALASVGKEHNLSPNIKQTNQQRLNSGIMDTQQSTRGSVGNSSQSHFGTGGKHQSSLHPHMDVIQEDEGMDRQFVSAQYDHQHAQNNNNNSTCNSPIKNDNTSRQDLSKKDVYVSFGNNKEALLHKAIQHVNNYHLNSQANPPPHPPHPQVSAIPVISTIDLLQQTPLHNNGVYVHQIKPLTDIIEHTNMNEEDDKSQPNTPELKQIDDIPSRITPPPQGGAYQSTGNEQQKPFRTLFGDEDSSSRNVATSSAYQQSNIHNNNGSYMSNINGGSISTLLQPQQKSPTNSNPTITFPVNAAASGTPLRANMVNANNNSNGFKYGSSGSTKSPRYSMYECEDYDQDTSGTQYPVQISKNNNQLDDYLRMIERQTSTTPASEEQHKPIQSAFQYNPYSSDMSYTYQKNSYYNPPANSFGNPINQSHSRLSLQNNKDVSRHSNVEDHSIINQQDDDEVIVTHEKHEEQENPLFSSPGYKQ